MTRLSRFSPLFLLAAMALAPTTARAETLRITCDNVLEELYVDGAAVALGANAANWMVYDDLTVNVGYGPHTIAFRALDQGSVAGCMAVLYADDGTSVVTMTADRALRSTNADPGAGWSNTSFDDSAWDEAVGCTNRAPWGSTLNWGFDLGADMVWGTNPSCPTTTTDIRRWFRWDLTVPCYGASDCDDRDPCTTDSCGSTGLCMHSAAPEGTRCAGGVCNGSSTAPACVACVDSSATGTDAGCTSTAPHCRTSGSGAPRCEPCIDSATGSRVDLGCSAAAPYCVPPMSITGSYQCVACMSQSDCDDGNACTTDSCNALGACVHTSVSAGTTCPTGVCNGSSTAPACVECVSDAACEDGNACTTNACTANACTTTNLPVGTACGSGNVCDATQACASLSVTISTPADGTTTTNASPAYTGMATPGATVTVTVDGASVGTTTAGADGSWMIPSSGALTEGSHTATATATAGAATATDSTTFTVDLSTRVTIEAPADGSTIADTTPELRGEGEVGATIVVTLDGVVVGTITVGPGTTWVLPVTTPLDNGSHTVEVTATDALGHTADASSTFTVDASTAVEITYPSTGLATNDTTPEITGTAVAGATVVVSIDGVEVGTTTADGDGNWSLPTTDALEDGTHTAGAHATDPYGNEATDTSTFTVDTETHVAITDASATSVSGTGEPGASVVVTVDGGSYDPVTVDEDGHWTLELDEPLGPGNHTVTAEATDPAGNTSTDTTTIDIDRPTLDGGAPDAGVTENDAATGEFDAGMEPGGVSGGACACSTQTGSASSSTWLAGLLLGLALVLRRRRRG